MRFNLKVHKRKIVLLTLCICAIAFLLTIPQDDKENRYTPMSMYEPAIENILIFVPEVPPPGITEFTKQDLPQGAGAANDEEYLLTARSIDWNDGCTPTSAGMLCYYYADNFGLDIVRSTEDDTISDNEHYWHFSMPLDNQQTGVLDDCSEDSACMETHTDDCIADYFETSRSNRNLKYGSTWTNKITPGLYDYIHSITNEYTWSYVEDDYYPGSDDDFLKSELKAGRVFILSVDSDADGISDHSVFLKGYAYISNQLFYIIDDTWYRTPRYIEPVRVTNGQDWGIRGYFGYNFGDELTDPDNDGLCNEFDNCPYLYNPDQIDDNHNGVGDVCEDYDGDGYTVDDGDCNDEDANIYPGATETCNGKDDDCDGSIDENLLNTYYEDSDGDGYGNPLSTVQTCTRPDGYAHIGNDCDDNDPSIPGTEVCDGIDNDCDGEIDEDCGQYYYLDNDGDGYGTYAGAIKACIKPDGYVENTGDCDDNDALINPNMPEIKDGKDNNCNGQIDEGIVTICWKCEDGITKSKQYVGVVDCPEEYPYLYDDIPNCESEPAQEPETIPAFEILSTIVSLIIVSIILYKNNKNKNRR